MARKVALGPLGDPFTAPANENRLWEGSIRVLDFDKCELNSAIREFVYEVYEFALLLFATSEKRSDR